MEICVFFEFLKILENFGPLIFEKRGDLFSKKKWMIIFGKKKGDEFCQKKMWVNFDKK